MGNWNITIQGTGIHHNGRQDDAETMASVFVGELRDAGHTVTFASFTAGGTQEIPAATVESKFGRVHMVDSNGTRIYTDVDAAG